MQDPQTQTHDKNWCIVILKFMGFYWRGVFIVIWPFLSALVFALGFEPKFRCLFVVVLMAGYWVTECIPLYVTGMFPVILLPLLSVQKTDDVCKNYMNKTNFIFMGSILIALGIEYTGLHYRIAYGTILCMGCSPRRLHFGLTMVTTLLSMFLTNSATTAMMCPIIQAVLIELEAQGVGAMYKPKLPNENKPRPTNNTIAYFLTASYASTIGGIGTLVGTGTNLTYKGIYEKRFTGGNKIEFVPWMLFNVPPTILLGLVCFFSLEFMFMGLWRPGSDDYNTVQKGNEHAADARKVIKTKMDEMGKFTWSEIWVLTLFSVCVCSWLLKKPQFMPGWGQLYKVEIADATPAIFVIAFFALIPSSVICLSFCTKEKAVRPEKETTALVPWSYLQQKFPWGLLFLLGGGFAIADASKVSGMSTYLGEKLSVMRNMPSIVVLAITSFFAQWATELTSNVAICNIIVPVLLEMSVAMQVHPIKFSLPAAVMCSYAFLLPVGTPPNAIAAEFANIRTADMFKGGIILKLISWILYVFLFPSYGALIYDHRNFPAWGNQTAPNKTL